MPATSTAPNAVIRIKDLRLHGIVGALPHERLVAQTVIVNAEIHCRNNPAIITDKLDDTIDYAVLCEAFATIFADHQDHLLERLTNRFLQRVLGEPQVSQARVAVAKPQAIANAETVEVELFGTNQEPSP